ncbi:MAG: leucine-rich repeat domain-containing protein [Promethearchaeota archaeon]
MVECKYESGRFYLDCHDIDDAGLPHGLEMEEYEVHPRKKYNVSDLIELWLVVNDTFIIVDGKVLNMCKHLAITMDDAMLEATADLETIDDIISMAKKLVPEREMRRKVRELVSGEEEFWAHCSNVQAWYDMGYDMRVIDSRLGARILEAMSEAGDPNAKQIFQTQMRDRLEAGFASGNSNIISVAFDCKWALEEIAEPEWWDHAFNKLPNDDKIREFAKIILYYMRLHKEYEYMVPQWVLDIIDEVPDHILVKGEDDAGDGFGKISRIFIDHGATSFKGKDKILQIHKIGRDTITLPKSGRLAGVKQLEIISTRPAVKEFNWAIDLLKDPLNIEKFRATNTGVESISSLNRLENVREIYISYEDNLKDISGISRCNKLETLRVRWCFNLESTKILGDLPALVSLYIDNQLIKKCNGYRGGIISAIEGINHLNSIQELSLAWNRIETIDGVRGMDNLRMLDLSANQLIDIDLGTIGDLRNLECIMLHINPLDTERIQDKFLELAEIPHIMKFSCDDPVYWKIRDQMLESGWKCGEVHTPNNFHRHSHFFLRTVL